MTKRSLNELTRKASRTVERFTKRRSRPRRFSNTFGLSHNEKAWGSCVPNTPSTASSAARHTCPAVSPLSQSQPTEEAMAKWAARDGADCLDDSKDEEDSSSAGDTVDELPAGRSEALRAVSSNRGFSLQVPSHQFSSDRAGSASRGKSQSMSNAIFEGSRMSRVKRKPSLKNSLLDDSKEALRSAMIEAAGGASKAFSMLDLNGSGSVSLQEFVDGLRALRVNWQDLPGVRGERDLILLFDVDRDGAIDLEEMFPDERGIRQLEPERMDTPEFWSYWCRRNRDVAGPKAKDCRGPMWRPDSLEERMSLHSYANWVQEEVDSRRRWISEHYRLLREGGRNNRQCRAWIAHHLPGVGNREARSEVKSFARRDVGSNRQNYQEQINEPVRKIELAVGTLREQRKELQASKKQLWSVVLEPLIRAQEEEDLKRIAAGALQGLTNFRKDVPSFAGPKDDELKDVIEPNSSTLPPVTPPAAQLPARNPPLLELPRAL